VVLEDPPRRFSYGTYGDCRRLGHAWFDVPSDWQASMGVPCTYRCERCGTERREQIGPNTGELIGRRYAYPEGYHYTRDETPTKDDFRRMFVEQMIRRQRGRRKKVAAVAS
jgi:hypothetical protein